MNKKLQKPDKGSSYDVQRISNWTIAIGPDQHPRDFTDYPRRRLTDAVESARGTYAGGRLWLLAVFRKIGIFHKLAG